MVGALISFAEDVSPATGALTVSVASGTPGVGALLTAGTNQATANGLIPIGASGTNAAGGVGFTFVPLSDGTDHAHPLLDRVLECHDQRRAGDAAGHGLAAGIHDEHRRSGERLPSAWERDSR